jgi:sulfotransferase family protein
MMNDNAQYHTYQGKDKLSPPIFIVGAPRSGTTLLAVLLDRHSNIAIGPETQFFTEFIPRNWAKKTPASYEQLVDSALSFKRIADFSFDRDQLLKHFKEYELSLANLLRAIIEVHAIRSLKRRPGEKTPQHLQHVPLILEQFPESRIVCVLRDGRDVVRSLMETPWAIPNNPRRLQLLCLRWNDAVEKTIHYQRTVPPNRFMTVKFEDILRQPRLELEKICGFLGEDFELTQLEPAQSSSVIPSWEKGWKNKASETLDPRRIEAWRGSADQKQLWIMNSMMGTLLERMGYRDANLEGCPPFMRTKLFIQKIPYLKRIRTVSAFSLKTLKRLKVAK